MIKEDYLKNTESFTRWMQRHLYDDTLSHSYIRRSDKQEKQYSSFYDAYHQYDWKHNIERLNVPAGTNFQSNIEPLMALQSELNHAIDNCDNNQALSASIDVMRWGGVTAGNVSWLKANRRNLVSILKNVREALSSSSTDHEILNDPDLRFNAGMTKIYSLIADDFIIYDSRVAAALGFCVSRYIEDGNDFIPELAFPWGPAKESPGAGNPKNRDPRTEKLPFPRLRSGPKHAQANLKASWLLSAVRDLDIEVNGKFSKQSDPLRALEAALFMIGYDLPLDEDQNPGTALQNPQQSTPEVFECFTLGRKNPFYYEIHDNPIRTYKKNEEALTAHQCPEYLDETVDNTIRGLWEIFEEQPFPLANSAHRVPAGIAPYGLGTAYHQASNRGAPETSKLAAILEDLDVLSRTAPPAGSSGLHFRINAQNIRDGMFSIRDVINRFLGNNGY